MASQSDKSGDDGTEQDPLLEALESIKHLLDETEIGKTPGGGTTNAPVRPAPAPGKSTPPRPSPDPGASGELDLPVLDEIVMPGQAGEAGDPAALARALRQIQADLARSIDLTLQQAAAQIADHLKQDLKRRIDAIVKNLNK